MNTRQKLEKYGLYDPRFEHDACGIGFVCDIKGKKSHAIVSNAVEVLNRLSHRGATGADPKTGDGAGILLQMPHAFLKKACDKEGIKLPDEGFYGTGVVFLPVNSADRAYCKDSAAKIIALEEQILLGWREVPVDNSDIGITAKNTAPVIVQVFIGRNRVLKSQQEFERRLYVIRKRIESAIANSKLTQKNFFYITNLSSKTCLYKGLLMPQQIGSFFLDLKDKDVKSALCLVHSRYSTNTFPTWDLAQPFRFLAHNGEINTLRGNINWMLARQGLLKSDVFGKDISKLMPVIVPGGSDSAALDNALELLVLSGRSIAHAMMMLIPSAWEQNKTMSPELRDFYKYHACFMEPWDGPAAVAVTDGSRIGAVLDRNGLRPARYIITKNDTVVMASEMGVLDIDPADILVSGRLEPGKLLFIDTEEGRIIKDNEIKDQVAARNPYGDWLRMHMVEFDKLAAKIPYQEKIYSDKESHALLNNFGYTREDMKIIIKPMVEAAQEPIGSMGNDIPLAILSKRPQLLYNYFKQLFAQVTNPAIDPIREELVMSLDSFIGRAKNLLEETPEHCHKIRIKHPVLTNEDLHQITAVDEKGFKSKTISILFSVNNLKDFTLAIDKICLQAEAAIVEGYTFIVLSDRGVNKDNAAVPALLAVGAVHHYLVKKALRTQIGIIVESGEPREVHHFGLLFGYGADCVNPYLAYEAVNRLIKEDQTKLDYRKAVYNYVKAVEKGMLKILSKMGISTLQSYRGAQIFEAVGLNEEVIERCFAGTVSRIKGIDFAIIAQEAIMRHNEAFSRQDSADALLSSGGLYQWRKDGEFHLWNPESISALQDAAGRNDPRRYQEFARLINDQSENPATLRGLLKFKQVNKPVNIEEVEPAQQIVRRFATGAMSFGSISKGAHETIAIAMNRLKAKSNTGEGGEDPARFKPLANGDSARSAIKQVASGRFGVTTNYLTNADEIQIKIAQGAKPGEGGQLPGHKVSVIIARTRYTTPGVTLISPPPHHDIYSIEDLAQLIFDLKNTNPRARISVKLVSETGVGTVAAGVAKGHADMILISGGDGGTGASPLSSIKHAGLWWELGLSETHQTLVLNDLRSRVRLQTDGQMRTGRDVAIAALLGAEEYGFCTAVLIILGCVMLRHCHLNNCSLGVATQDDVLSDRFGGKADHIVNYFNFVVAELRQIMADLGIRKIDEMIGRTDLLEVNNNILPWKARGIDFSRILYKPQVPASVGTYFKQAQDHRIDNVLDLKLIDLSQDALLSKKLLRIESEINNTNRTTGAMLSGRVCEKFGEEGLAADTIYCKFNGIAGQSFAAFLCKGITFELEGMANDYVGKGISGGKVIVYPAYQSRYESEKNVIIGNTTFYGAISGEAYIRGLAGERFCIRNSGLNAVVEGLGEHGCEYMTGGVVVVLGSVGRNFAAGMSGGVAYIYDILGDFSAKCNMDMVELEDVLEEDELVIKRLLNNHFRYTASCLAEQILNAGADGLKKFVKVMPVEYKRILEGKKKAEKLDLTVGSDG